LRQSPAAADPATRTTFPLAELAGAVVQASLVFDHVALERTLSQALAAHPLEAVCLDVLQPALVELGERWQRGEVSPAVEHFATALVRRRLEQLASILDVGAGRPAVVLGAAPGEQHELGLLIVSLFWRRRGLRVIYLGADVSLDAAVEVTRRLRPDLFCLSAATPQTARDLGTVAAALASLDGPRPRFAFGGRAFLEDPDLGQGIAGTFLGRDANEATAGIERLLRQDPHGAAPESASEATPQ
jgi:MerR family transcriptional regulator, light-induced transcriptional regulator